MIFTGMEGGDFLGAFFGFIVILGVLALLWAYAWIIIPVIALLILVFAIKRNL